MSYYIITFFNQHLTEYTDYTEATFIMTLNVDYFLCWFGELYTDVHSEKLSLYFSFSFIINAATCLSAHQ